MNRRDFLATLTTAVASTHPRLAFAAGPPKIFLFGLSVIDSSEELKAFMPPTGQHRVFAAGQKDTIEKIFGTSQSAGPVGLHLAHSTLPKEIDAVACVPASTQIRVSTGPTTLDPFLPTYLPSLKELGKLFEPQSNPAIQIPNGTVALTLGGGHLRTSHQPSECIGTHGFRWQFSYKGQPKGPLYALTDLVVFDVHATPATVTAGAGTATLAANERLWLFNVPTITPIENPKTPFRIEHASDWFELVNGVDAHQTLAETHGRFTLRTTHETFRHPCVDRGQLVPLSHRIYFPPDSDPCFAVRA